MEAARREHVPADFSPVAIAAAIAVAGGAGSALARLWHELPWTPVCLAAGGVAAAASVAVDAAQGRVRRRALALAAAAFALPFLFLVDERAFGLIDGRALGGRGFSDHARMILSWVLGAALAGGLRLRLPAAMRVAPTPPPEGAARTVPFAWGALIFIFVGGALPIALVLAARVAHEAVAEILGFMAGTALGGAFAAIDLRPRD